MSQTTRHTMSPGDILTGQVLDDELEFTLGELCRLCSVHAEAIIAMVEEGLLDPCAGRVPAEWRFSGVSLTRAQQGLRLQHDLGVNLAGAALAIDLMEQIDRLRDQLGELARRLSDQSAGEP